MPLTAVVIATSVGVGGISASSVLRSCEPKTGRSLRSSNLRKLSAAGVDFLPDA